MSLEHGKQTQKQLKVYVRARKMRTEEEKYTVFFLWNLKKHMSSIKTQSVSREKHVAV